MMDTIEEKLYKTGIVPVVAMDEAKDAAPLAKALIEGGIPCAEVTFRTECAEESIRLMKKAYPHMLVGAGTVLTKEQADLALAAGAEFIVSPGFDPEIVDYCIERNVRIFPGCISPSEIISAIKRGIKTIKFFPAQQAGGVEMIKALSAPYSDIRFMPTGGIGPDNLRDYLKCESVLCCGGSWMVKKGVIRAGEFGRVREMAKEAKRLTASVRPADMPE